LNNEYQFIRLADKKIFGLTKIWVSNHQVSITDQEKTLADCLARPQYCGGISEAIKGLYNFYQLNKPKNLFAYTRAMGQPALKRLGYLLELLGLADEKELVKIKKLISNPNFTALEPLLPTVNSVRNSKWKLQVNVVKQDLLSWKTK
jgi:predicted transcriptional regulator of viral defense system